MLQYLTGFLNCFFFVQLKDKILKLMKVKMLQIIMKTFKHTLIKQDMNKLIHFIVKYINQACTITAQSHSYLSQSIKHSTSNVIYSLHCSK